MRRRLAVALLGGILGAGLAASPATAATATARSGLARLPGLPRLPGPPRPPGLPLLGPAETEADGASGEPSISGDGRYVAFASTADNLTDGDDNGDWDVYVRDLEDGSTERVSVSRDGGDPNGPSYGPRISADGRYVAFYSHASNLVDGDTNNRWDVFVRDLVDGTTERVSVPDGASGSGGGDGDRGGQGNGDSVDSESRPAISADGRYIGFSSKASNLVAHDDNHTGDVFVRDTRRDTTTRVDLDSDGHEANGFSYGIAVSADGRYAAFTSLATNLVPGDTNRTWDVFVRNLGEGTTARVSRGGSGAQGNAPSYLAALDGDGGLVAFESDATNLVRPDTNKVSEVFARDLDRRSTERASANTDGGQPNGYCGSPDVSRDGRWVAFAGNATNLVDGDTNGASDVFVRDRARGTTVRVSVDSDGTQGNGYSSSPSLSRTGRYVAFTSSATNLVPDDTNGTADVFVRDLLLGTTDRVSVG